MFIFKEEIRTVHNFEEIVGNSDALLALLKRVDQGRAHKLQRAHLWRDRYRERVNCEGYSRSQRTGRIVR
jgi:hypothetical protein